MGYAEGLDDLKQKKRFIGHEINGLSVNLTLNNSSSKIMIDFWNKLWFSFLTKFILWMGDVINSSSFFKSSEVNLR
jgi:hypothetical protein